MAEECTKGVSDEGSAANLRGSLDHVKLIATGGMAQIFRARQPALDRYIAVKRLKEELLGNPEAKERFRREAKALASVLHQNIAHVYDFVETNRESYILMEYIDGIDLSDVIAKLGHIPSEIAASILIGVSKGVNYIHDHRLIHRDIKPSNIRLTSRGEVKLMDFGIVMDIDNESLTRPGMMVGSPCYLSPEQVLGDTLTSQADIFLLGICLYEMLTGAKPFIEGDGETVFQKIRDVRFRPVRSVQPQVPSVMEKIVHRCLKKSLEKRYATVQELIGDLEAFVGPMASAHTDEVILHFLDHETLVTPSVPLTEIKKAKEPKKKKRVVWPWVLLLMAGLLAAGCYYAFRYGMETGINQSLELKGRYGEPKPIKKH